MEDKTESLRNEGSDRCVSARETSSSKIKIERLVYVEKGSAPVNELSEVFNYDRIIEAIEVVVQEGHIDLQETLLERTAERLLKYPEVAAVQIGSEKPDAYSKAESIGVEAFFSKDKERTKNQ